MSINIEVDITELEKLRDDLVLLQVTLEKDIPSLVLERLGNRMVELAKQIVPVRTGRLRDSIMMKSNGPDMIVIGSDVDYSVYVELGTSKMSAKPYLIPALFQAINELAKEFPEYLEGVIQT